MKRVTIEVLDSTAKALENISQIVDSVALNQQAVVDGVCSIANVEAWFKEYISSEAFSRLRREIKQEALDTFTNLQQILQCIHDNLKDK